VLHIHNSESENTCSYNSLGKHCQIMFLRTFGGRRPPTLILFIMSSVSEIVKCAFVFIDLQQVLILFL
jgi:hypothetical protein